MNVDWIRIRFWLWTTGVAMVLTVFASLVWPRLKVETDILALLPTQTDAAAHRAIEQFSQALARKMIFLVGDSDLTQAEAAATQFATTLRTSGAFARVDLKVQAHVAEQLKLYQQYRGSLLAQRSFALLRAGLDESLLQTALQAAFTPLGLMRALSVTEDPLGLATDYIQQQIPAMGAAQLEGALLTVRDGKRRYVLFTAELAGSPFATEMQTAAMAAIASARENIPTSSEVLISGTVQHAAATARNAQHELNFFGGIETVAVMLLLYTVFGTFKPLGLGALTLAVAFLTGMTVTHCVFGKVHVLALVFGSSLIGGVIDYSIHFFADRFRVVGDWTARNALEHVGGAIVLGLTATLLGYVVLLWVPFPGLRQIAVFCSVGLIAGCGTVLCWYPVLYRPNLQHVSLGPRLGAYLAERLSAWQWTPVRTYSAVLLVAGVLLGLTKVHMQDDVRALQSSPAALMAQEQRVAALLGTAVESRYFLVRADSEQALLETEEHLTLLLDDLIVAHQLSSYTAVTRSLPSYQKQREAQALLQTQVFGPQGLQARAWSALGFATDAITQRVAAEPKATTTTLLSPAVWLASPVSEPYRSLWLSAVDGHYASIVSLGGIKDLTALQVLAQHNTIQTGSVRLVDRLADVTAVLHSYRVTMSGLLMAVYVLAGLLLARQFSWATVPNLLLPSALASLLTLGLFGWFAVPVNLFTLLALWLVLGLGVDYGIFLRHGCEARSTAVLSVTLSAITTLLAFGLLAWSKTPFIHNIGLTLLCAICLSWLCALLSNLPSTVIKNNGN